MCGTGVIISYLLQRRSDLPFLQSVIFHAHLCDRNLFDLKTLIPYTLTPYTQPLLEDAMKSQPSRSPSPPAFRIKS